MPTKRPTIPLPRPRWVPTLPAVRPRKPPAPVPSVALRPVNGRPTFAFRVSKRLTFEASHILPHHDGQCARLHGHSWIVDLEVEADALIDGGPKDGMVLDYADLKALAAPLIADLDHYHLNDVLDVRAPTSERLAVWLYDHLAPKIATLRQADDPGRVLLAAVTVHETATTWAEYRP